MEMPDINTKLFTEDSILSEFNDSMDNSTLMGIPTLDLSQISPSQVTVNNIVDNSISLPSTVATSCPKSIPTIKPNRKIIEKPIQPNLVAENTDNKIGYIQKPGVHSIIPIQNVRQIHLPPEQMKQVLQYLFFFLHIIN